MILQLYAVIGFAFLIMLIAARSHKIMNALSIAHPAVYIIIAAHTLSYSALPEYFAGDYFFMDHLGVYEALVTASLFLLAGIYSRGYVEGSIRMGELNRGNLKLFYMMFNVLLITIMYSFFSNNLALFWILAELTTAFSAVLIVTLNAKKNIGAALKYVFITSSCMLFSFIGLIFLFALSGSAAGEGTLNWSGLMRLAGGLSPPMLLASFLFTFAGFAAKSGIVPFHAWLPSAHSKAPAPISAILSGSVASVGIYGILRMYAIVAQTSALPTVSAFLIAFGILSMAVAALTMFAQANLKKLIGYSTIEHAGFMLVGLGIGTPIAVFWVAFHVLAHSFTKALLFFSAGIMHHQYEGVRMENIRNAFKLQPFASWGLVLGSSAIIGMPMFAVFLPKISILFQSLAVSPFLAFGMLLIFTIAAGAFGMFLIRLLAQKEESGEKIKKYDAPVGMKIPVIALIIAVTILGIYFPQQLSDLLNSIVAELGIK